MGKYDKDRAQKELSVRFCLARRMLPFMEVVVYSASELSDTTEVLTDIDVLGVEQVHGGSLRRTVFDCKTDNKMSAINRAFWAAGLVRYASCDEAYVLLKNKAVQNHRITALTINIDLHDENSFRDLGDTIDAAVWKEHFYQSSLDRWDQVYAGYVKNQWSKPLFDRIRNEAPLSRMPWTVFRQIVADLRSISGEVDPDKKEHLSIFFDVLTSGFLLWATLGRDVRRLYEPSMDKASFEKMFRYYIWGGRDGYHIRKQLREKLEDKRDEQVPFDLPAWNELVSFAGLVLAGPRDLFDCAHVCRELSIRSATQVGREFDARLTDMVNRNRRVRQFVLGLSGYLIAAGRLPKDMNVRVEGILAEL